MEAFPSIAQAYLAKIERPLDLGEIERSLRRGSYESADDLVADVRLVFDNACRYNAEAKEASLLAAAWVEVYDEQTRGSGWRNRRSGEYSEQVPARGDDTGGRIFDIANHLRDYVEHLALELFFEPNDPASGGKYLVLLEPRHEKIA